MFDELSARFEDAVKAVSEPDKKPEIITSKVKQIKSKIVSKDIYLFNNFLILFKFMFYFKKDFPILLSNIKFTLSSVFFLSL